MGRSGAAEAVPHRLRYFFHLPQEERNKDLPLRGCGIFFNNLTELASEPFYARLECFSPAFSDQDDIGSIAYSSLNQDAPSPELFFVIESAWVIEVARPPQPCLEADDVPVFERVINQGQGKHYQSFGGEAAIFTDNAANIDNNHLTIWRCQRVFIDYALNSQFFPACLVDCVFCVRKGI